jgi:hypothetical protein
MRHSAITDDSDHLPEYAVKKKARWTINSQQGKRYIKNRWGDDLRNKILEHHGIKIANKQQQMVSRTCGRCGYVNNLGNKYCEKSGCAYPLTQSALDEIKAVEEAKLQTLRNEILETKVAHQNEMQMLNEKMDRLGDMMMELNPNMRYYRNEFGCYTCTYEDPLTDEEKKELDEGVARMEQARKTIR